MPLSVRSLPAGRHALAARLASRVRGAPLARYERIEPLTRRGVAGDALAEGKRRGNGVEVAPRARAESSLARVARSKMRR